MSIATFLNVWMQGGTDGERFLTLLAVAENARDNGEAAVSVRTLGARVGLSRRVVSRCLDELCEAGDLKLLARGTGRYAPSKYQIAKKYRQAAPDATAFTVPPNVEATGTQAVPVEFAPRKRPETVTVAPEIAVMATPAPPPPAPEATEPAQLGFHHAPSGMTQQDVDRVLNAAGVAPPPGQPFYWLRVDHQHHLRQILDERRIGSTEALCMKITGARSKGATAPSTVRSMRGVVDSILGNYGAA